MRTTGKEYARKNRGRGPRAWESGRTRLWRATRRVGAVSLPHPLRPRVDTRSSSPFSLFSVCPYRRIPVVTNMDDDYYSIESILAENQKIQCTFKVDVPDMGHLDGGKAGDVGLS